MSENNKDKFLLDEILSEYTPKTAKSSGEMDVEDIINETNLHTAMAASAEMADGGQESAETADTENTEVAEPGKIGRAVQQECRDRGHCSRSKRRYRRSR